MFDGRKSQIDWRNDWIPIIVKEQAWQIIIDRFTSNVGKLGKLAVNIKMESSPYMKKFTWFFWSKSISNQSTIFRNSHTSSQHICQVENMFAKLFAVHSSKPANFHKISFNSSSVPAVIILVRRTRTPCTPCTTYVSKSF